jgi:hypothetical protein
MNERHAVKAGITQVPFDILPYATLSWDESVAFGVGLEDDIDLGAVYTWNPKPWRLDLGYFPRDDGIVVSLTKGWRPLARYGADLVPLAGGGGQQEIHQGNFRLIHTWDTAKTGRPI